MHSSTQDSLSPGWSVSDQSGSESPCPSSPEERNLRHGGKHMELFPDSPPTPLSPRSEAGERHSKGSLLHCSRLDRERNPLSKRDHVKKLPGKESTSDAENVPGRAANRHPSHSCPEASTARVGSAVGPDLSVFHVGISKSEPHMQTDVSDNPTVSRGGHLGRVEPEKQLSGATLPSSAIEMEFFRMEKENTDLKKRLKDAESAREAADVAREKAEAALKAAESASCACSTKHEMSATVGVIWGPEDGDVASRLQAAEAERALLVQVESALREATSAMAAMRRKMKEDMAALRRSLEASKGEILDLRAKHEDESAAWVSKRAELERRLTSLLAEGGVSCRGGDPSPQGVVAGGGAGTCKDRPSLIKSRKRMRGEGGVHSGRNEENVEDCERGRVCSSHVLDMAPLQTKVEEQAAAIQALEEEARRLRAELAEQEGESVRMRERLEVLEEEREVQECQMYAKEEQWYQQREDWDRERGNWEAQREAWEVEKNRLQHGQREMDLKGSGLGMAEGVVNAGGPAVKGEEEGGDPTAPVSDRKTSDGNCSNGLESVLDAMRESSWKLELRMMQAKVSAAVDLFQAERKERENLSEQVKKGREEWLTERSALSDVLMIKAEEMQAQKETIQVLKSEAQELRLKVSELEAERDSLSQAVVAFTERVRESDKRYEGEREEWGRRFDAWGREREGMNKERMVLLQMVTEMERREEYLEEEVGELRKMTSARGVHCQQGKDEERVGEVRGMITSEEVELQAEVRALTETLRERDAAQVAEREVWEGEMKRLRERLCALEEEKGDLEDMVEAMKAKLQATMLLTQSAEAEDMQAVKLRCGSESVIGGSVGCSLSPADSEDGVNSAKAWLGTSESGMLLSACNSNSSGCSSSEEW